MTEDIEKQIEREIQTLKGGKGELLNNFRFNLYAGRNREDYAHPDYAGKTFEDFWDKSSVERGSEMWKKQTPAEFFALIDEITSKKGISFKQLESLQKLYGEAVVRAGVNELIFPIYVELRKMGYHNYPDLCGEPNVR